MKPRLGFFGFAKDIDAIATAGYDRIEMHMREIMPMDEPEFKAVVKKVKDSSLVCEILDNPVPLDQVVADESFDLGYYRDYLQKGADRAAELGIKFYIYGNGRTRSLPLEGDIEAAKEKHLKFMRMLADITARVGITILIEPLAPTVSNVIHSIPEAIEYIKVISRPNLDAFLDYRWFVDRNHPYQLIEEYGEHIRHVHIDNPDWAFPKRLVPKVNDGHDYANLFSALERINYTGIISIEANTFGDYEQDLRDGIAFFAHYGIFRH